MLKTFRYEAPGTLKDILGIIGSGEEGVCLLAGGTDIMVEIRSNLRSPRLLVDIKRAPELSGITHDPAQGLAIGASVTMGELIRNPMISEKYPFLRDGALHVASPQLRNRATLVGNICTASPCTDMGRVLLSLDASVVIASEKGERVIPLSQFFKGVKKTCLEHGEMVTSLRVPASMAGIRAGHEKLKRLKGHDIAVASVSMAIVQDQIRIAVGSCSMTPVLVGPVSLGTSPDTIRQMVEDAIAPIDDVRATAAYRKFMVGTFVIRLLDRLASGSAA